jgi:hypothetical protein
MTDDEQLWKGRLLMSTAVRLVGLGIFFTGIAIMYTGIVRPGGWPQVGAIVAILGAIDAVVAPQLLRRAWKNQDRADR